MGSKTTQPKARIATGSFIGDGAATQAITGIGFQPEAVLITDSTTGVSEWFKVVSMGINTHHFSVRYADDMIISFDSDGFTIGDRSPMNTLGNVCFYVAFRN